MRRFLTAIFGELLCCGAVAAHVLGDHQCVGSGEGAEHRGLPLEVGGEGQDLDGGGPVHRAAVGLPAEHQDRAGLSGTERHHAGADGERPGGAASLHS